MKKKLLFLLFISFFSQAQRTLPYPIIFVHGWVGSDSTWYGMGDFLKGHGISVSLDNIARRGGYGSRLDFHLNADGNNATAYLDRAGGPSYYGDVYDYNSYVNPENDIFFVNFDNDIIPPLATSKRLSNQAAIVKQGFAVGLAVKKVLNATKASKVILVGHSMGGLAIREYLQNSVNWLLGDGQHHIAKLVTIGTPNRGSNSTSGGLVIINGLVEWSEAVRDLRYPASYTSPNVAKGVYLYGGDEKNIDRLGNEYYNSDVNCDGSLGYVQGLNQKSFPASVAYSCVVGTGSFISGLSPGDGVVEGSRASLFNLDFELQGDYFEINKTEEEATAYQYYSPTDKNPLFGLWHGKLTKQRFINTYALDEPSRGDLAFSIEVGKEYRGFFTPPTVESKKNLPVEYHRLDMDTYKVFIDKPGVLTVNIAANSYSGVQLSLYNQNWSGSPVAVANRELKYRIPSQGTYYITIHGNSGTGSALGELNPYTFKTSFCPLELPFITAGGNTTLCEGQALILSTDASFEDYRWYKNGVQLPTNSPQITTAKNQLTVSESGIYKVEAMKCGIWLNPDNGLTIQVNPLPAKPIIVKEEQPNKFILASSSEQGNQWFLNGKPINGATSKTYIPDALGVYSVMTTQNNCSNQSEAITIKIDKPIITYNGSLTFFEGDSLAISGPDGFSSYDWQNNGQSLNLNQRKLSVKKSGNYRLAVGRGKLFSDFSDVVTVTVNPILAVDMPTSVNVYPNPNRGKFWIDAADEGNWQYQIFNLEGKTLLNEKTSSRKVLVNFKATQGLYFLKIITNEGAKTTKLILD